MFSNSNFVIYLFILSRIYICRLKYSRENMFLLRLSIYKEIWEEVSSFEVAAFEMKLLNEFSYQWGITVLLLIMWFVDEVGLQLDEYCLSTGP